MMNEAPANANLRWYVVHAYSGMEKAVERNIRERIERAGMHSKFGRILVPTEEVVELKNGKKAVSERRFFPGYVLVEMIMDQETAHTVNGIQGVIKFVGHERLPQPLRPDEVNRLLGVVDDAQTEEPREEIPFLVGQAVAITEGPFTDFNGTVEELDFESWDDQWQDALLEAAEAPEDWTGSVDVEPEDVEDNDQLNSERQWLSPLDYFDQST